jgi:hypothetical protein
MGAIEVECYAGYRGEQEPRTVVVDGRRLLVREVLSQARGTAGRHFRVRCDDGREYELFHDDATGAWSEVARA